MLKELWQLRVFLLIALLTSVFLFVRDYKRVARYEPTAWLKDIVADCGVVLTGGPVRVREGFDLLSQGLVKKLIISGVNPKAQLHEIFPLMPFYPSVNEMNVILERRSTTTYGNVHQTIAIAEALRCKSLVLVTSRTHMYRAKKTFQAVLPESLLLVERAVVSGPIQSEWSDVMIETLKSVFYSLWAY